MKERILIIENNAWVVDSLSNSLRSEGYQVTACFDGHSAIKYIENEQYDLIVTDLLVPFVSGINIVKHIRLHKPCLPIFVISSILESTIIDRMLLLGVTDFIKKPFNSSQLCLNIKKRLEAA